MIRHMPLIAFIVLALIGGLAQQRQAQNSKRDLAKTVYTNCIGINAAAHQGNIAAEGLKLTLQTFVSSIEKAQTQPQTKTEKAQTEAFLTQTRNILDSLTTLIPIDCKKQRQRSLGS